MYEYKCEYAQRRIWRGDVRRKRREKITGQKLLVRDGKSRARLWAEDEKNEGGSVERNCDREENLARHVWEGQWNTYSGTGPASSPLGGSRGSPGAFGSTVWGDEAPKHSGERAKEKGPRSLLHPLQNRNGRARECRCADSPRRPFGRRNSGAAEEKVLEPATRATLGALVHSAHTARVALRSSPNKACLKAAGPWPRLARVPRTVCRLPWGNVRGIWGWQLWGGGEPLSLVRTPPARSPKRRLSGCRS